MAWNPVKLTPRTTPLPFSVSLGCPGNPSSSLHIPLNPKASGSVDRDKVNTDGKIENKGFTIWGTWNMSGLNTVQVVTRNNPDGSGQDQNTLEKTTGYSWTCALGGHQTVCEKHVRRFLIHVRKKTGALQIGVSDLSPPKQSPGSWDNVECVGHSWFVTASGDIYNGNQRLIKTRKPIVEDDIIGLEVDLSKGLVVFRKIPASLLKNHVFGGDCGACGGGDCKEWNKHDVCGSSRSLLSTYGYLGQAHRVMSYAQVVTVGNLPAGRLGADQVWRHHNSQPMHELALDFLSHFGCVMRLKCFDPHARSVTVEMDRAFAVAPPGRVLDSPLHRILQLLVHPDGEGLDVQNTLDFEGSDVEEDKAGRPRNMVCFYLIWWLKQHKRPAGSARSEGVSVWDKYLGDKGLLVCERQFKLKLARVRLEAVRRLDAVRKGGGGEGSRSGGGGEGGAGGLPQSVREAVVESGGEREAVAACRIQRLHRGRLTRKVMRECKKELESVGPWVMPAVGRGTVVPGVCMCGRGTEVHLAKVSDALEDARNDDTAMQILQEKGRVKVRWELSLTDACIQVAAGVVITKTNKGQVRDSPVAGLNVRVGSSRNVYHATAVSSAWMCRTYPPRMQQGDLRTSWTPHFDGLWAYSGKSGTYTWVEDPNVRLNVRRFDFKLLQLGPNGKVNSGGIFVGLLALPRSLPRDQSWCHSAFKGRAWYVDGSRGRDANGTATGGALYCGDTRHLSWAFTKMPALSQGDTLGMEVNLGVQKRIEISLIESEWVKEQECDPNGDGTGGGTIRFFVNGKLVKGMFLLKHVDGSEDVGETMPVHPAVCLHQDGDAVEMWEISAKAWPCPHDSYSPCSRCLRQKNLLPLTPQVNEEEPASLDTTSKMS